MNTYTKIGLVLCFAVFTWSCNKSRVTDYVEPVDEKETLSLVTLDSVLLGMRDVPERRAVNRSSELPLLGLNNSQIWFFPEAFTTETGQILFYPFEYDIYELSAAKDLILYKKTTTSNNIPFSLTGMLYFGIIKDGFRVYTSQPNGLYNVKLQGFRGGVDNQVRIYYSAKNLGNPSTSNDNWEQASETNEFCQFGRCYDVQSIITGPNFYQLHPNQLGWLSVAKPVAFTTNEMTDYSVKSNLEPIDSTYITIYFPEINSLVPVTNGKAVNLPIGLTGKLTALAANKAGNLFSYYEDFTVTKDGSINLDLKETTEASIANKLATY